MSYLKRLLLLEPFWLLLLGVPVLLPGKLIPSAWHPYLLGLLFAGWLLRLLTERRLSASTPILGHILFILCWLPITLWASADRATSWIAVGYLLFGITLYVALVNWKPAQRQPQLIAWFLLLIGGGLTVISPVITEWKSEFRLFHLPLYAYLQGIPFDLGETIHANVLAGVLVLVLPFFALLAFTSRWIEQRWPRLLCGVMVFAISLILVLTQSRGGYMAAVAGVVVLTLMAWPKLLYTLPLVALAGFLVVRWFGVTQILNALSYESAMGGWAGRLDIWTQSWRALNDFLFTGIGIGTFTLVIPLLYPLRVNIEGFPHAHNLFLQIGVDLGLPGLLAYLLLLFNLSLMVWHILRRTLRPASPSLSWCLAASATASLVAFLVHGLVDAVTWGTKLAFVPWVLFALITQLYEQTAIVQK